MALKTFLAESPSNAPSRRFADESFACKHRNRVIQKSENNAQTAADRQKKACKMIAAGHQFHGYFPDSYSGGPRGTRWPIGINLRNRSLFGPKAQPLIQPRASPWEMFASIFQQIGPNVLGPTGQPFVSLGSTWRKTVGPLARSDSTRHIDDCLAHYSPGRCPGMGNRMPLRGGNSLSSCV
jgi:hypothetical protein